MEVWASRFGQVACLPMNWGVGAIASFLLRDPRVRLGNGIDLCEDAVADLHAVAPSGGLERCEN